MAGPFDPRTDRQRELVGIAAELGTAFAKRADRYDREASFPYENFDDLRDAAERHAERHPSGPSERARRCPDPPYPTARCAGLFP